MEYYFGIDINRTSDSGDFLLLYLRTPTEVMLNNQFQDIPAGTYSIYKLAIISVIILLLINDTGVLNGISRFSKKLPYGSMKLPEN